MKNAVKFVWEQIVADDIFLTVPRVRYLINKKNYQVVYISLQNMKKVPCDVFSIQYKFSIYLAVFGT